MGLGIAVVLVAGVGRLAVPAAAGTDDAAVAAAPPPTQAPSSAPAAKPRPTAKPTPTYTPTYSPPAIPTHSSYSSSYSPSTASRYSTRTPVAKPSPAHPRPSTPPSSYSSGPSTPSVSTSSGDPRSIARAMLAARGWGDQFSCLDPLWNRESGWSTTAGNPDGAYGIPQALPGSKMASAGSDWRTNARTQITWGLNYIASTYGSPCAAWSHSQSTGWY